MAKWPVWFWIGWTLLNLLHASLAELVDDEAYYWVISRHLAWGAYDHPPMTAAWIAAGYAVFPSELGVRLLFVLAGTATLWIAWRLCAVENRHFMLFAALVASLLLAHFGGVLAVPDVALGFFTALYWLLLRAFLTRNRWSDAVLLGAVMAGMAYSKYHGGLVVIFTLLAYPSLLRSAKTWLAAAVALLLFTPHLWWQFHHEWVTFRFHLIERQGSDPFRWKYFAEFIGGQMGLYGPLMAIPLCWLAFRYRPADAFEKVLSWNAIGFFLFFLLMSFKGHPEPNWTSPALVPLIVLAIKKLAATTKPTRWVYILALPSLLLILFGRATMMFDFFPPTLHITREFHGAKAWAQALASHTGHRPALFTNSYQDPSKYYFYTGVPASPHHNYGRNRRSQFDYMPILDNMRGKEVAYMVCRPGGPGDFGCDTLVAGNQQTSFRIIRNFQLYPKVSVTPVGWPARIPADTLLRLPVAVYNGHPFAVHYQACPDYPPAWGIGFSFDKRSGNPTTLQEIPFDVHPPGATLTDTLVVRSPATPGRYFIVFGIRYDVEPPGRNGEPFPVEVY